MSKTQLVAKAILLDSSGNFLCLYRGETHPSLPFFPDLPGGGIEPGEEPGDGVKREIREETSLEIDSLTLKYATTMYVDGISYPTLLYIGSIDGTSPEVALSYEHSRYEWLPIERLAEIEPQIAPTYSEALQYLTGHDLLT